ncbi:hypothetical protein R1sor_012054 [Riccia sorocarpa]|uniref:Uncharacterized protein n=1 Tax=Riccia sorocarpa TaxID=122646 RepID=A0ABD3I2P9_9MARC
MDDPLAGGMDTESEERSRDLSTRNDVAAVHKQSTDNHELDEREDESDSKSSPPRRKTKTVSFCRLVSHRDFLDSSLMVIGTLGAIAAGVSQPLLTVLFGHLLDALDPRKPVSNSTSTVNTLCMKLFYTALGCGFGSLLEVVGWTISAERQAVRLRSMYLKALLRQNVGFFDQEIGVGEAINKISGDILLIQDAMGDKVASVIELTTRFVFGFGVGFYTSWKMTLVTIAALPPIAIVGSLMAISLTKATNRVHDAYSEAGVTVNQALGSIRTIASNTGEKRAVEEYDNALEKAEKAGSKLGLTNGFGLGAVFFTTLAAYGLAMWYGSRLVADGEATAGEIIRALFSVVMGGSALGLVVPFLTGILAGLSAGYSMFQIIDRKPPIDSENLGGEIIPSVKGEIQLKNVHFAYPTRPEFPVFTDFSLLIQAGSTTALVGESGSGKSSVIQLIERFYDPQNGQVLLDGVDIRELQLKWLRSQIALVSQEPVLFATSIGENIRYGKEDATHQEIEAACLLANAALFIDRMPEGYDTLVGDRGIQLSGGQKQRVAIARAILKNPRILLLDEATSALDAESEHMVQDALDRLSTHQTTVVIAHRLSTIKNASLIAVVQSGTIVETGVHEELSQNPSSAYSQLIRFQEIGKPEASDPESNTDINNSRTVGTSGRSEEGSFRKPSNRSFRDDSSRRLATQVNDLLEPDSELGKEDKAEGDILVKQKVSLTRLAGMNKPELPFFLLGAVGAAGVGAILPAFAFCLDKSIVALQQANPGTVRHDGGFYALLFVVLGAAHILFTPCEKISFAYAGERLLRRLRLKSFEKILRQEVSWFDEDRNSSAILSSKLLADAAAVRGVVGDALCTTVEAISTLIVGFSIAFSASWELALVILGISPFLGMQAVLTVSMEHQPSKTDQNNVNQAAQVASDAVSNIRTVASFSAEEKMVQLYAKKLQAASIANIRKGVLNGLTYGFANFCLFCGYAIAFYAGAKFAQQGRVKINEVFLVILTMSLSSLSLANALRKVPELARCKPAIRSIFALLDMNSKVDPLDDKGVSLKDLRGHIDFQAVTFRYPTRPTVPVLQGLSFTLKSGTTLALVGGSGSGKSTVISLIERFYDPLSGSILIDGHEIQALNITWLRQNIGLVSQEPVLFDDTIRGNILHGKGGSTTEDEIHEAARFANAHAFISALPDGYSTRVGERGVQLSGGQKQRVAIARAILKNPNILLLDEATSALDAESEHIVQEALDRVMVQRSTIIVAHRLSTVRNAQQILVLKNGHVAEKGTYSELLSAGGLFASLAGQTFTKTV